MAATDAIGRSRLEELRVEVERALVSVLDVALESVAPAVADPIRYAVLAPGKRVRPLLVVAAWDAIRGPADRPAALFRLACGVELVHAYSLIHDDLPCMDDDDLRRGRPTVHIRFGERAAVFAGAALMPLAVETVGEAGRALGLDDAAAARLIDVLTVASGGAGMVGGQLLDLRAEGRVVEVHELDRIQLGKTGRLIEASCVLGGLAAGADSDDLERLRGFGLALGLAFQVVDDILDVTGDPESTGKAGGRDAALGKATYPQLVGLEGARERARSLTRRALDEVAPLPSPGALELIARAVLERQR